MALVVLLLAIVWVCILQRGIGPVLCTADGRLVRSTGRRIPIAVHSSKLSTGVVRALVYEELCGSASGECLLPQSASDVNTCETCSVSPYITKTCCHTTRLLTRSGFEPRSPASEPSIIAMRPVVWLGQQSRHCERMNNTDNLALRPRVSWLRREPKGFRTLPREAPALY